MSSAISLKLWTGVWGLLLLVGGTSATDFLLGTKCEYDHECANTTENAVCVRFYTNCQYGICECELGYAESIDTCYKEVGYLQACDNMTFCYVGECSDRGRCECIEGMFYSERIGECIPFGMKAISEICYGDAECIEGGMVSECVADPKQPAVRRCRCKKGYKYANYRCRHPSVEEACVDDTCETYVHMYSWLERAEEEKEVCMNGTCTCPCTSNKVSYFGHDYEYCQKKFFGLMLDDGERCMASNQCKSKACSMCPNTTENICVNIANPFADTTDHGTRLGVELVTTLLSVLLTTITLHSIL